MNTLAFGAKPPVLGFAGIPILDEVQLIKYLT